MHCSSQSFDSRTSVAYARGRAPAKVKTGDMGGGKGHFAVCIHHPTNRLSLIS